MHQLLLCLIHMETLGPAGKGKESPSWEAWRRGRDRGISLQHEEAQVSGSHATAETWPPGSRPTAGGRAAGVTRLCGRPPREAWPPGSRATTLPAAVESRDSRRREAGESARERRVEPMDLRVQMGILDSTLQLGGPMGWVKWYQNEERVSGSEGRPGPSCRPSCSAGVISVGLAAGLLQSLPDGAYALVVSTETITPHFSRSHAALQRPVQGWRRRGTAVYVQGQGAVPPRAPCPNDHLRQERQLLLLRLPGGGQRPSGTHSSITQRLVWSTTPHVHIPRAIRSNKISSCLQILGKARNPLKQNL